MSNGRDTYLSGRLHAHMSRADSVVVMWLSFFFQAWVGSQEALYLTSRARRGHELWYQKSGAERVKSHSLVNALLRCCFFFYHFFFFLLFQSRSRGLVHRFTHEGIGDLACRASEFVKLDDHGGVGPRLFLRHRGGDGFLFLIHGSGDGCLFFFHGGGKTLLFLFHRCGKDCCFFLLGGG